MNFDFSKGRITLIVAPVDMRYGYRRLSLLARALLDLDVDGGKEFVVFASKSRSVAKMIWADGRGTNILSRRLHQGRFERFLAKINGPATLEASAEELMQFLDGRPLFAVRSRICSAD